ncbi:hypothetical protein [Cloacibacterium normanense]|nr:hypothetical protein [Cloacibacterium normanense]
MRYLTYMINNKLYSDLGEDTINDFYTKLNIQSVLKDSILQRIDAEADFEISVAELQQLVPALSARIDELIGNPNFNPFKERLRQRNPVQFGSNPFTWKGVTYYLYVKTNPIDSEISRTNGFLELTKEFINQNKPLKYIYKIN